MALPPPRPELIESAVIAAQVRGAAGQVSMLDPAASVTGRARAAFGRRHVRAAEGHTIPWISRVCACPIAASFGTLKMLHLSGRAEYHDGRSAP